MKQFYFVNRVIGFRTSFSITIHYYCNLVLLGAFLLLYVPFIRRNIYCNKYDHTRR